MSTKIKLLHPKAMLTLGFYSEYQKKIMDEYKYDNAIRNISCFYEPKDGNSFVRFEDFSFSPDKNPQVTGKSIQIDGIMAHYSTTDGYQKLSNLEEILEKLKTEKKIQFILFIYGDLKSFCFRHKFILLHKNSIDYKTVKILRQFQDETKTLLKAYLDSTSKIINLPFYNLLNDNKTLLVNDFNSESNTIPIIVKNALYSISSDTELSKHLNNINSVILIKNLANFEQCMILNIENINVQSIENIIEKTKEQIKETETLSTDLKGRFNPETIAENAVDLNINLMKWRMCPCLNTDIIRNQKYLLVGAGTLGCHVSRCLLGWGARHITFIDNGKVSYSNPVRQSLYEFEDSKKVEDNYKAILAAKKLKQIFPMTDSNGYNVFIPLPGRTLIDDKAKEVYIKNLNILEEEIKKCDIMFLLTDSRESRWYPTVIAKALNKIVITAAIGFDSYLVMRHGTKENDLGCYFCTDITTPGDTSGNRTLDQQCTISRPGASMISSGLATELAMSCGNKALNPGEKDDDIPHQIRGNLLNYEMAHFHFKRNKNCVACSDNIIKQYTENRDEFLVNVMNDPYYVEKTCGVHEIIKEIKVEDVDDNDDF